VPITALDLLPEAEATKWWKLLGVDHRTLVRLPGEAPSSLSHVERHQPRQLNVKALPSSKRAKQVVKRQPGEAKSGSAGQADKGASVLPSQSVQFTLARALTGHLDSVHSNAISPDGQTLATCSSDNTKLWNLHTGKRLRTMKMTRSLSIEHIVISSDGHLLSSGGQSLPIKIWNPHTGELLRTLRSSDDITCLVFSPDGQILACGGLETSKESGSRWVERGSTWKERRGLITLWNPYTGKLLRTITGNTERSFTFVVFSPDGQLLASSDSSLENSVALWNPYTGEHFRTIPSIHPASKFDKLLGYIPRGKAIAFSPDGQLLASDDDISDGIIELWNPHTGELVGTIPWQPGLEHSRLIAFSPDGQLLVCGNINIWKKTNAT